MTLELHVQKITELQHDLPQQRNPDIKHLGERAYMKSLAVLDKYNHPEVLSHAVWFHEYMLGNG